MGQNHARILAPYSWVPNKSGGWKKCDFFNLRVVVSHKRGAWKTQKFTGMNYKNNRNK